MSTRENAEAGIREFEAVLSQRPDVLSADDRLILARLYLTVGENLKARTLLSDVAAQAAKSKDARHLVPFVSLLLSQNELVDAGLWLKNLEEMAPDDFATVDLRARLLARQNQMPRALATYRSFVESPARKSSAQYPEVLRAVAGRSEELGRELQKAGRREEAIECDTLAAALWQRPELKTKTSQLDWMRYLIRRGRIDEALAQLDAIDAQCSDEEMQRTCVELSALTGDDPKRIARVEAAINGIARKHPGVPVWLALAQFYDRQRRYDECEANYRKALAASADHVVALNNLAFLLAVRKTRSDEALTLIDRAIAKTGPLATLLDSRSVVQLACGRHEEALRDADSAVSQQANPLYLFHQVQASLASGQKSAAMVAWNKARQAGLSTEQLHPLERPAYDAIKAQLDSAR